MISYNFDTTTQVLNVCFSGTITKDDVVDYYQKLFKENELPENLKIFQDERYAEFIDSESIMSTTLELIKVLLEKTLEINIAIWQTGSLSTAYSLVFEEQVTFNNYFLKVFYTKEAAIKWLNME